MTLRAGLRSLKSKILESVPDRWKPKALFLIEELRDWLHPLATLPRRLTRRLGRSRPERVLGVFNLSEHHGAFGDTINFLENLNVVRAESGLERIDLCVVFDRANPHYPGGHPYYDDPARLEKLLGLQRLLPNLDKVIRFDSDAEFEKFFALNFDRCVVFPPYGRFHTWPSRINYANMRKRARHYHSTILPIERYHAAHGRIPHLAVPQATKAWALEFLRRRVFPAMPIVTQLRRNPDWPHRDSDLAIWRKLLTHFGGRDDRRFLIIGDKHEIVPEFRELPGVLFTKDFDTTLEQDLALIELCYASVFPSSGTASYAWFTGVPLLHFGVLPNYHAEDLAKGLPYYKTPGFFEPHQKLFWGPYTGEQVLRELDALLGQLEQSGWKNPGWTG